MKFLHKADRSAPEAARADSESPKTGLPELDENPKLLKLMLFALNEACKEIARTGGQTPLAVIETPTGQYIQGFTGKRLEFEYEEARQALLTAPSDAERYALAWAGYLTLQGIRYETVLVGGGERGKARGATMGQRYKQHLPEVRFQPIGNPTILGPGDNLLTLANDPEAASKLRPAFERITADVDHNRASGNDKAPAYEFKRCAELILSFGDLDLPFRKELQKKPDSVHVVMNRRAWATAFKPDAKEVFLNRGMLFPIRGNEPFMGFNEDGLIMICYMPPVPTGDKAPAEVGMVVYWMAEFKISMTPSPS
ncbi:MAG TPA: hypothetical protein VKF15_06825 [Nitrososphaerales archaeon]|nr:hypothetical protein [Nitrososphaerales archaeon]